MLEGTDVDGDFLTFSIAEDPQNGDISLNNSLVVYSPDENFNGPDSFTFTVSDGILSSNAIITLNINPVAWSGSNGDVVNFIYKGGLDGQGRP